MRFYDLHCDTIYTCRLRQQALRDNDLQISLRAGAGLAPWGQTFAIYIPEERRGEAARSYYEKSLAYFRRELDDNREYITLCANGDQMDETLDAGRCAAVLAVENASALNGDIEYLDKMRRDGVRMITMTWNGVNEAGCGLLSGETSGLTAFGKNLLREMEKYGIVSDVSHLNHAGFWDVVNSGAQVTASHTSSAAVWAHPRSLDDEQIDAIIKREGLIGICLCRDFLGEGENTGREAVLRQFLHILELGGENALAIGSDFDGAQMHPELDGIQNIEPLYRYLSGRGLGERTLDNIFFRNAYSFFKKLP